jgi:hypothetical protein
MKKKKILHWNPGRGVYFVWRKRKLIFEIKLEPNNAKLHDNVIYSYKQYEKDFHSSPKILAYFDQETSCPRKLAKVFFRFYILKLKG